MLCKKCPDCKNGMTNPDKDYPAALVTCPSCRGTGIYKNMLIVLHLDKVLTVTVERSCSECHGDDPKCFLCDGKGIITDTYLKGD